MEPFLKLFGDLLVFVYPPHCRRSARQQRGLQQGAQEDQSLAFLFDLADRILPQFHLQEAFPHPQDIRAQL
jgi:hypothetical protein